MKDLSFDRKGIRVADIYKVDHSRLYEILEKVHSAGATIFIREKGIGLRGELESNFEGSHTDVDIGLLVLGYNCNKNNSDIYLQILEQESLENRKPKINLVDMLREYII